MLEATRLQVFNHIMAIEAFNHIMAVCATLWLKSHSRQFAQLRICENILPATGPVGSGGDQGRDFETYRSCLISTPIATSTFLGMAGNTKIVFACSLQERIRSKIKEDVTTICSGNERIDAIYYFCEADLAIAQRHELQQWCRDDFNTALEIFTFQRI